MTHPDTLRADTYARELNECEIREENLHRENELLKQWLADRDAEATHLRAAVHRRVEAMNDARADYATEPAATIMQAKLEGAQIVARLVLGGPL